MKNRDDAPQRIKQWRKSWGLLTQSAIWVLGILGGFLLPPPVGADSGGPQVWERLAQFVITVMVGLLVLAGRRWKLREHAGIWATVSGASLVGAVTVFLIYQNCSSAWTADYLGERVVIGSVYTEQGRKAAEENSGMSSDFLLLHYFAGKVNDMYTEDSIRARRLLLAAMYLACLPLFTVCLMSTVQALSCRQPARKEPQG